MAFDSENAHGVGLPLRVLKACFRCIVTIVLPFPLKQPILRRKYLTEVGSIKANLQIPITKAVPCH
jgi:hypothetical protein